MSTKTILLLAFAAVLSFSCADISDSDSTCPVLPDDGLVPSTIIATIDPETKTALGGDSVTWEKGDQIAITPQYYTNIFVYTLVDADAGKKTGRFTGSCYSGYTYDAVYPASALVSSGTYVNIDIPSVQTYRDGSFSRGANISVCSSFNPTGSPSLEFKNTGGLLKLTLKGSGKSISRIEVSSENSAEFLAGSASLKRSDMSSSSSNFTNLTCPSSTLTLDCGSGAVLKESGTDFYLYVPSDRLASGFRVKAFDSEGEVMLINAKASEKNRIIKGDMKEMPPVSYKPNIPSKFIGIILPGHYSSCMTAPSLIQPFLSSTIQSSTKSKGSGQVFSVKNWNAEWVVDYVIPGSLSTGNTYEVSVNPVIGNSGIASGTLNLKLVLAENGLGWFLDESTGDGYIFNVLK